MAAFGNAMRLNQFYLASIPNIVEGQGPGGTVLVCLVCLACLCYVGVLGVLGVPCVPGFPGVIGVLGVLGVWSVSALWLLNVRIYGCLDMVRLAAKFAPFFFLAKPDL